MTPEQTVAWETEHRSRVVLAAVAAALLVAAGSLVRGLALGAMPDHDDRVVTVVDALRLTSQGDEIAPGQLAERAIYLGDHVALPILGAILYALGTILLFPVLAYLFRATRARRPQLPQIALVTAAIGAVACGVGRGVADVGSYLGAAGFADQADRSNSAAADAFNNGVAVAGGVIGEIGALALAFTFILIGLNAMRVGLLTRFLGMIAVIVGITFVLPLDQQGVLRIFWLLAFAFMLSGRMRRGMPPAWAAGEAVPWPSQLQLREEREAARAAASGEAADATASARPRIARAPAPRRPEPRTDAPHASSKKRKRKRRT